MHTAAFGRDALTGRLGVRAFRGRPNRGGRGGGASLANDDAPRRRRAAPGQTLVPPGRGTSPARQRCTAGQFAARTPSRCFYSCVYCRLCFCCRCFWPRLLPRFCALFSAPSFSSPLPPPPPFFLKPLWFLSPLPCVNACTHSWVACQGGGGSGGKLGAALADPERFYGALEDLEVGASE